MKKTYLESLPYNPLDKENLGKSVAEALISSQVFPLPPDSFLGAGVYAIYYKGDFPPYEKLAQRNHDRFDLPIYVGKAEPPGKRKGKQTEGKKASLHKRLTQHAVSISMANNLKLEDFFCRYLVVDDIWISLAESVLINKFKPLWNACLDGFGNHNPGAGRLAQQRSEWDCMHEGRKWADKLPWDTSNAEKEALLLKIENYLKSNT